MALALVAALVGGCAPDKPSDARQRGEARPVGAPGGQGRPSAAIEQEPVVVVDGEAVSLGEFDRRVQDLPEFARARFSSIEQKQGYLDSIAQFELMADVAERQGLADRPEVLWALEEALADRLVEQVVGEKLSIDAIEDEAVERYYEQHREAYRRPAARRVALIEVDSAREADRVRSRVLDSMEAANDSPLHAFRRAAARYSVDRRAAQKGGDIGFVEQPSAPSGPADAPGERIARQVFDLDEPGQVTPVFAVDGGYGLATFLEERPAEVTSVEEAAGEIRAELYERRRQQLERQLVAELRESRRIDTFDEVARAAEPAPAEPARRIEDIELDEVAAFAPADGTRGDQNADTPDHDGDRAPKP